MRALIAVSDKTGLVDFARELEALGWELIATSKTHQTLIDGGLKCTEVAELTGVAELLEGRVKTLHPAVHAGILAKRDSAEQMEQLAERDYQPIDMVVVSLYPYEETVAAGGTEPEIIEKIDIGGPTMIRGAAKNWEFVTVVTNRNQYATVLDECKRFGQVQSVSRRSFAAEAFAMTAAYDTAIADHFRASLETGNMPARFTTGGLQLHPLRYGENPHQEGALYRIPGPGGGVAHAQQLAGVELSFTNWLDVDSAWRLANELSESVACIIKHTNPCGVAIGTDVLTAYRRAYSCDPRSAFGGVVGVNRRIEEDLASEIAKTFIEAVIAPGISDAAKDILVKKSEKLRILVVDKPSCAGQLDVRSIDGGLLVQTTDRPLTSVGEMTVMTKRQPTQGEWEQLLLAWKICCHVKSNAIVLVKEDRAVGVGAGQMSRVESCQIAITRAGDAVTGTVAASDAFFPMADGIETLAAAGVSAIIQPGGSKKDEEVVAAADRLGLAMVATGERHFRH